MINDKKKTSRNLGIRLEISNSVVKNILSKDTQFYETLLPHCSRTFFKTSCEKSGLKLTNIILMM